MCIYLKTRTIFRHSGHGGSGGGSSSSCGDSGGSVRGGGVVLVLHLIAWALPHPELGGVVVAARAENVAERMPREVPHAALVRVHDIALEIK